MGIRARYSDIRLFCVKDAIGNNEVKVTHCPKQRMIADHNAKPLVGGEFKFFLNIILNLSGIRHSQVGQQECVGQTRACVGT